MVTLHYATRLLILIICSTKLVTYCAKTVTSLLFSDLKAFMSNYNYYIFLLVSHTFRGCGGPERYQMLIASNGNYRYFERNVYCHILNVNAM